MKYSEYPIYQAWKSRVTKQHSTILAVFFFFHVQRMQRLIFAFIFEKEKRDFASRLNIHKLPFLKMSR